MDLVSVGGCFNFGLQLAYQIINGEMQRGDDAIDVHIVVGNNHTAIPRQTISQCRKLSEKVASTSNIENAAHKSFKVTACPCSYRCGDASRQSHGPREKDETLLMMMVLLAVGKPHTRRPNANAGSPQMRFALNTSRFPPGAFRFHLADRASYRTAATDSIGTPPKIHLLTSEIRFLPMLASP
jgi:hypothetical protein